MTNTTNTTKNTMTQAQALAWLIENAPENAPAEVMEAANKLYIAKTKKYDRPKNAKTKERILNESLVAPMVELMERHPEDKINATWLFNHFNHCEVRSPQKARVIIDIAIENGQVEKYQEKGRTYYKVA